VQDGKRANRVPLSPRALRILKDFRNITDKSKWVFPSTRNTGRHTNHAQKAVEQIVER
jgi:integrase